MKEQYHPVDDVQKISSIQFCLTSPGDVLKYSTVQIVGPQIYDQVTRQAITNGPLDVRLGPNNKVVLCQTCQKKVSDCPGHFGMLELALPCFHVGYFKACLNILQMICKTCSRVMLTDAQRVQFKKQLNKPGLSYLEKRMIRKQMHHTARKCKECLFCNGINGIVKKVELFKIGHDRNKAPSTRKYYPEIQEYQDSFATARKHNRVLDKMLANPTLENLNPSKVLQLFKRIPMEDIIYLGMNFESGRPEDMIVTAIPIPPNTIRPSAPSLSGVGTTEDDLTMKIRDLVVLNDSIANNISNNALSHQFMENWYNLQINYGLLMTSELSGLPKSIKPDKLRRGLVQRLKGKQGRFRGNLSGKRVDFTSRTVISPDPNLRIDQVGIPIHVAKTLTYPERVNRYNIELLRKLVLNGSDIHPGANFIEKADGFKRCLVYDKNRSRTAKTLRIGDTVERHLMDGDVCLFNRQPSLHRMSIMAHFAKIGNHRTFRFNECVCNPYNADFDGDEMNVHLPQTEEAKAEALLLMGTKSNIVTPRNGEPLIAAIQDFITAAYLLTQANVFFTRVQATQLAGSIIDWNGRQTTIDLPPPAIWKPVALWTGKQVFGLILKPNKKSSINMYLETQGRQFKASSKDPKLCQNDSYVVIRNSQLLCGHMDKKTLGAGSKSNIFYTLLIDYGQQVASDAMWRLAKLCPVFLSNRGFSIGIGDVSPGEDLLKGKQQLLEKGYQRCEEMIEELKAGKLPSQPGCSPEETLESLILKELSTIRSDAGTICKEELEYTNTPLTMAMCGSKGSYINISQMIACVGQQAINGKRVPNGFEDRSLPHFKKHSKVPAARGFVANSFFSGLTPTEFFFHTMAGREGLVDTAVKTAETGYMQRRLIKSLEDLCANYDMTVRSSGQEVVQFKYGDDGLDPSFMEGESKPVDFKRVLQVVKANYMCPHEPRLVSESIPLLANQYLEEEKVHKEFKTSVINFLQGCANTIASQEVLYEKLIKSGNTVAMELGRLTESQLSTFITTICSKFKRSVIEPGTAVGALCAQSIGEPGTQMTLKTFHFAGVAAMNITLGVPRIKEIINAALKISTPIIDAQLTNNRNSDLARTVKGRIEKTTLGEVTKRISEKLMAQFIAIIIEIDLERCKLLQLNISVDTVIYNLMNSRLPIKQTQVEAYSSSVIVIRPEADSRHSLNKIIQKLREAIPKVVISGSKLITRAVIHYDQKMEAKKYKLIVEGNDLAGVMSTYGVKGEKTVSNNVKEVEKVLGIEAARSTIISEVKYTMDNHGISVDMRHLMLLADIMTTKGQVLGITRFGLERMKESVLMLASFEKTADHLFDAAYYGQKDVINGVSECIIMGIPMNVGTGIFKVLHKPKSKPNLTPLSLNYDCPGLFF